jgi:hypothetical protein
MPGIHKDFPARQVASLLCRRAAEAQTDDQRKCAEVEKKSFHVRPSSSALSRKRRARTDAQRSHARGGKP